MIFSAFNSDDGVLTGLKKDYHGVNFSSAKIKNSLAYFTDIYRKIVTKINFSKNVARINICCIFAVRKI